MANRFNNHFLWLKARNFLTITLGTIGILSIGAIANSDVVVAQNYPYPESGGIRSRIVPPTPLNISPRTHIPLPRSNRSYYRDAYRDYDQYENCDRDSYRYPRSRSRRYEDREGSIYYNRDRYPSRVNYIRIIR
jgi:hypothetical protein